jgi:MarR family transcriptional regulator, organic hydroperoxide resistance regulator
VILELEMKHYAERFGKTMQLFRKKLLHDFQEMPSVGLTTPQFHILMMVKEKGPCKVTTLAELMGVKPSAISVMIDKLVAQGLVDRQHQENDRRVVMLSITDTGNQTLEQMSQQSNEIIGGYFNVCTPEEIEKMIQTLEKITTGLADQERGNVDNGNRESTQNG